MSPAVVSALTSFGEIVTLRGGVALRIWSWLLGRRIHTPLPLSAVEFEVPNELSRIVEIRNRAAEFARAMPFTKEDVEDIRLAVGEAATNAVRHGTGGCRITVHLERNRDAMVVTLNDGGCGFDPKSVTIHGPEWLGEGGRGIWIMHALMDDVTFSPTHPGTSVRLVKRLHGRRKKR